MDMLRVTSAQRILPCVGAELARPDVMAQMTPQVCTGHNPHTPAAPSSGGG